MIEEARDFLYGYMRAKRLYRQLLVELEEKESIITSISIDYSSERVQTSPKDQSKRIDYLADLRTQCIDAAWEALEEMNRIGDVIRKVEGIYGDVLHRKYIEGKSLRIISDEIHYSYASVRRIHKRGLQIVGGLLKDEPQ